MRRWGKRKDVIEATTDPEIARAYHEIRQTLRVSGVPLAFRVWATRKRFFLALWDGIRPNLETRAFERAADRLREEAAQAAWGLALPESLSPPELGDSQRWQLRRALDLYRYHNPKVLLLSAALSLALADERIGQARRDVELIERGIPSSMPPMELVINRLVEARVTEIFVDIEQTLDLSPIDDEYRTLALWPDYLFDAWTRLKGVALSPEYGAAATALRESARGLAWELPYPVLLTRARVYRLGEHYDEVVGDVTYFEQVLPSLLLNGALLGLEWFTPDLLMQSPYPPRSRGNVLAEAPQTGSAP